MLKWICLSFLLLLGGWMPAGQRTAFGDRDGGGLASPKGLLINIGTAEDEPHLGEAFGWSRGEKSSGVRFRWIKHLEADLYFNASGPQELEATFRAAPNYLNWQRQRVALFVNLNFVSEWICPDKADFEDYTAMIPEKFIKKGRNRITFRMGYRKRHSYDKRELSLAMAHLHLRTLD